MFYSLCFYITRVLCINPDKLKFQGGFLLTSPSDKFTYFSGEERIPLISIIEDARGNQNYGTADDLTAGTISPQADDTIESTGPGNSRNSTYSSRKSTLSKDTCMSLPANFDQQEALPVSNDSTL